MHINDYRHVCGIRKIFADTSGTRLLFVDDKGDVLLLNPVTEAVVRAYILCVCAPCQHCLGMQCYAWDVQLAAKQSGLDVNGPLQRCAMRDTGGDYHRVIKQPGGVVGPLLDGHGQHVLCHL